MAKRVIMSQNNTCVACNTVKETMFNVGAFYMCQHCVNIHYPDMEYDPTDDEYQMFLKKYTERCLESLKNASKCEDCGSTVNIKILSAYGIRVGVFCLSCRQNRSFHFCSTPSLRKHYRLMAGIEKD